MKLTAIFLFAACLTATAKGFTQTVSLSEKDAPLEQVFKAIEKQTGYTFFFDYAWISKAKKVTIELKNATLEQALEQCFRDQPLTYKIIDKTIVVKPKEAVDLSSSGTLPNQKNEPPSFINIHGRILNEKGEPVIASVQVKGTSKGTTTNDNGEFELKGVEEHATLVISGVSIETFEVKVNGRSELALNARVRVENLNEVVINKGYYSVRQRENTGSVSKVSGEEIEKQPVSNPLAAIEGRMTGVMVTQPTGVPGGAFNIQIRGQNSLRNFFNDNGNLPLFIIDGVPYPSQSLNSQSTSYVLQYGNPLSALDVNDIESIEVLKDADATSIYGARGANGVVLITTKKGRAGKTRVDVQVYGGGGKITRMMDLMDTRQYLQMRREAFKNDGTTPTAGNARDLLRWDTTRYTDWQKELIGGTAHLFNSSISFSGGNNTTQFLVGGSYNRQTTVFPGDFNDQKASADLSLNHQSGNGKLRLNLSAVYVSDNNNILPEDLTREAITLPPNAPALYDSLGNLNWQGSTWTNPLSYTEQKYSTATDNLISNFLISYQLLPGLSIKTNLGYNKLQLKETSTSPLSSYDPAFLSFITGSSMFANNYIKSWIVEPQVEYQRNIGKGSFSALVGTTFQASQQEGQTIYASGYNNDALIENILAATSLTVLDANYSQYRYDAIFGRINYNLKDKYLINITGRRDGSSRFGPDKQFANFGAIGVGWIFSNEKFYKNSKIVSFGKLRGSYGTTGSDQIGDYNYLDSYSPTAYPYNGNTGLIPTRLPNPDYSWELNKKLEFGLELGFVQDRIFISSSYYRNRSSNQLVGYSLPAITGQNSVQYNLPATVQNTGVELELNTVNISTKDVTWRLSSNISFPRNKLIAFPNLQGSPYANIYEEGKSLYIKKLYHFIGVDPNEGIYLFEDVNKDGIISSPEDLTADKEISQKYFGGLSNSLRYKGFQLDLLFQFVKQTAWSYLYTNPLAGAMFNQPTFVLDRWQKPGDIASIEAYSRNYGSQRGTAFLNYFVSDAAITDASFIRLKNFSLSYSFPPTFLKKMKITSFKLYIRAQNLLTLTNYQGMDPEQGLVQNLPPLRMIVGGLSLQL